MKAEARFNVGESHRQSKGGSGYKGAGCWRTAHELLIFPIEGLSV